MVSKKWLALGFLLLFCLGGLAVVYADSLIQTKISKLEGCISPKYGLNPLCKENPDYISIEDIPRTIRMIFIISEDASFFIHSGLDLNEVVLSLEKNIAAGSYVRGASTISQQLVKNVFLSKRKTLLRKLKEVVLTVYVERIFNKNLILEKYLNVVQFGNELFGIKNAAKHYFDKSVADLNISESIYLAHLLPSPTRYSNSFKAKKLSKKNLFYMNDILNKLHKYQKISQQEYESAQNEISNFFEMEIKPTPNPMLEHLENKPSLDNEDFSNTKDQDSAH